MFFKFVIPLFLLTSSLANACSDSVRYGDPCIPRYVPNTRGESVYQEGDVCTLPLLYDGVCPDYLVGGCAVKGECKLITSARQHRELVVFGDSN